jgi:hypothetical protein
MHYYSKLQVANSITEKRLGGFQNLGWFGFFKTVSDLVTVFRTSLEITCQ